METCSAVLDADHHHSLAVAPARPPSSPTPRKTPHHTRPPRTATPSRCGSGSGIGPSGHEETTARCVPVVALRLGASGHAETPDKMCAPVAQVWAPALGASAALHGCAGPVGRSGAALHEQHDGCSGAALDDGCSGAALVLALCAGHHHDAHQGHHDAHARSHAHVTDASGCAPGPWHCPGEPTPFWHLVPSIA